MQLMYLRELTLVQRCVSQVAEQSVSGVGEQGIYLFACESSHMPDMCAMVLI